jgi:23S rRNA U2552 (ribose-2'-O)-methylase RlmE/FtsJ
MLFSLLPSANRDVFCHIKCVHGEPRIMLSESLSHYLSTIKNDMQKHGGEWDVFRKYTNPYEYINTPIPETSKCVSKYKPLSRSYFKMIELVTEFELIDKTLPFESRLSRILGAKSMRSFHLAEGPGGFIEALSKMRKNPRDSYVGITLQDTHSHDDNIPGWKKSDFFLKSNPNVYLENGVTGTGDILSLANFDHCAYMYASSMDLITADGGFDFSCDFNNQEVNVARLLFGQVCYALCLQKKGGSFILKIFDCFMEHTVDMLYILSVFYKEVYVTKPNTSRYANSEKYVVCKDFLHASNESFLPNMRDGFISAMNDGSNIRRFLTCSIPVRFTNKIEEYNAIFGHQQIDNIQQTIRLIENSFRQDKIDALVKTNVQKCVGWCVNHDVLHNGGVRLVENCRWDTN